MSIVPGDERVRRVVREGDYETLVQYAEELGSTLADQRLTTSQIRTVFGEMRRLQTQYRSDRLRMLKPKLAYMAARSGEGGRRLREVLDKGINEVFADSSGQEHQRFRRLMDFFEAILAYHKAKGGRD